MPSDEAECARPCLGRRGALRLLPLLAVGCSLQDRFEPLDVTGVGRGSTVLPDAGGAAPEVVPADSGASACARDALGGSSIDPACGPELSLSPPDAGTAAASPSELQPDAVLDTPCEAGFGPFSAPEPMLGLAVSGNLYGPALSADGIALYFSVEVGTSEELYRAVRADRASATFSAGTPLGELNSAARDGTPFVSADERELYFFSERAGGAGSRDLWRATREAVTGPFSAPAPLAELNTASLELLPWLTQDLTMVLFVSNRPGGSGQADIWMARRPSALAAFDLPIPMAGWNSPASEGRAVLARDGLSVIFTSDRAGGRGFPDLWTSTRADRDGEFGPPTNLFELNSAASELDAQLSGDGRELIFASTRSGASLLYRALRDCR